MADVLFKKIVKLFKVKASKAEKCTMLLIFFKQIVKPIIVIAVKKLT